MRERFSGHINADNTVVCPGRNFGRPGLTVHHETAKVLVLKWHGHNAWSGRGQQSYHPTQFIVIELERPTNTNTAPNQTEGRRYFGGWEVTRFPVKGQ